MPVKNNIDDVEIFHNGKELLEIKQDQHSK